MIIYSYKIKECGFYKKGKSEPEFGSIEDLLNDFMDWVSRKANIVGTATFENKEENIKRVFCVETYFGDSENNIYGITLWNEVPRHEEGVLSIPMSGKVGEIEASTTEMSEDSIPGWPTYLLFIPDKSLVVSLVPDNMRGFRGSGMRQAKNYFENFLLYHSKYVFYSIEYEEEEEIQKYITGWGLNRDSSNSSLYGKFITRELTLPGYLDGIRKRCSEIRKLIIKTDLNKEVVSEKNLLDGLLKFVGLNQDNGQEKDQIKYKTELEWRPNKEQLETVIQQWHQKKSENADYEIGVVFKGESSKTYWFGHSRGKIELDLHPELQNPVLWSNYELKQIWSLAKKRVYDLVRSAGL